MSRSVGKKSERSKAQAKALEEGRVDPAVTRLQGTLEENLDFFMHNIGGLIKDLNGKLDASKKACDAAHKGMGVSLTTALVEQQDGDPTTPVPSGSPVAPGAPAVTAGSADADAEAAAAAIAAKVREADERRKLQRAATDAASPAGSPRSKKPEASAPAGDAAAATATATASDAAAGGTKEAGKTKGGAAEKTTTPIVFPDNTLLQEQLLLLKKEAYALGTTFDGIHDWIALSIPDYKEEDNTNVEVMGAVIQQVGSLQETVREVYSTELTYLEQRADLEKALLKVPDSDTIARQLELTDLDTWDDVERGWRGMIRVALILFTMLSKNMKALREPRKSRPSSLFA